jgi:MoaA/NifB/PqqE/SkfB family radical SAM enzyme
MIELEGIEKGILNYNKSSKDSLIENLLPQDYKMLLWHINTKCNFKCKYCGYHLTPEEHFCYDAIVIRRALKKLSDKLVIFISSYGEPFLYPNFLEIVNLLSKDNILSINTNLSHQLVYQLPESINVLNIMAIHAAFHVEEIERHYGEKGIFEFIKKVAFLEEKGFNVVVSYLAYPSLFNRIVKDIQILRDGGIKKIMAKPFIGIYKNKQYPHSYSNNEWMILKKLSTSNNDVDFLDLPESFSNRCAWQEVKASS